QWINNSDEQTVQECQSFTIFFVFRNNGTTPWSDDDGYALDFNAYHEFPHKINNHRMGGSPVGFNGRRVAPGEQHKFTVSLVAPPHPGKYTTWWNMTNNG